MSRTGAVPQSLTSAQFAQKGVGSRYSDSHFVASTAIASIGQAIETKTLTVSTNTADATYTFAINGITLTATGGASATLTGDAIVTAIAANALANAAVSASNATGTVTLTSRNVAQVFYLTSDDTKLTVAAGTAQDIGDDIDFGAAIIKTANASGFLTGQAAASKLTAKAVVITPTAANSTLYQVNITVHPETPAQFTYNAAFTSDGSGTVQEIVEGLTAAVNAVMPANTVIATEDNSTLTLTAEVAGLDFIVSVNGNLAVAAYTGNTLWSQMVGVSASDDGSVVATATDSNSNVTKILGGKMFTYYRQGQVVVETDTTPGTVDPVCVRVSGSGALFSPTPSATHLPLPSRLARWMFAQGLTSTSRGVVQLAFA